MLENLSACSNFISILLPLFDGFYCCSLITNNLASSSEVTDLASNDYAPFPALPSFCGCSGEHGTHTSGGTVQTKQLSFYFGNLSTFSFPLF